MLEEFLGREDVAPILARGWVDVMIDVDRDTDGKALNERLQKGRPGGLPWMVVLDGEGRELVTSNAEPNDRNIGGPVADWECAWFVEMLKRSAGDKVTAEQIAAVAADLEEYAAPRRRPR